MITALDVLIIVILALFALIGVWRGLLREALVTGSILLGAILVVEWEPWLAGVSAPAPVVRFLVSMGLLLGVVFVIGYGSALLLPARRPTRWGRAAGGLVGLLNAALIVGYLLRYVQEHLYSNQPTSFITQSALGWFLANLVVVIFLLPIIVLAPIILVVASLRLARWLRGGRSSKSAPTQTLPRAAAIADTRPIQRPNTPSGVAEAPEADAAVPSSEAATEPVASVVDESHDERRCPTCGREVSGGARFCRFCGRSL